MIPQEVPFHEVEHDIYDNMPPENFWPNGTGMIRTHHDWINKKGLADWEAEIARIEASRAQLGGFGFR